MTPILLLPSTCSRPSGGNSTSPLIRFVLILIGSVNNAEELPLTGLRPPWLKKLAHRKELINVKAETLREKATFKGDLSRRRCLVLADSFYEWTKDSKPKVPYRILLKSGEPFAFAGIWEDNTGEDGNPLRTFAIITTAANSLVSQVHDRMPVILKKDAERRWIENDITQEKLLSLLYPYPEQLMQMYEISTRVNRTSEDSPEIIKPIR
ncbi:MAG TPA: SOS response-associated peptidase [Candidatus Binatia bacterium]|nr:SOS response-associated peptidase [Candidatus Binatia bacterium]